MLRRIWWTVLLTAALALPLGCARGPDEAALRKEVEEKLTKQVRAGLFEVDSFRRKGSAPLPASEAGASRLVVYYSAGLRFKEDVDFAGWDKMSPKSLAFALGATEKGLFGVKQQNKSGDPLHVFGTSTYEWTNGAWKSAAPATTGVSPAPDTDNTAPPSRSKQLIDKLAAMVNVGPVGLDPQQDAIISDELDRATGNITRRLERRKQVYTVASGPGGGEYAHFGNAFVETVRKARPELGIRHLQTQGSVENARLLARGGADYAIVQGDVAAQALAGQGPFAQGGRSPRCARSAASSPRRCTWWSRRIRRSRPWTTCGASAWTSAGRSRARAAAPSRCSPRTASRWPISARRARGRPSAPCGA